MAETSVAASPEPEGAVVLSPESSERQYYREPTTGFQREIWRPGDGDGSQSTDYYQRTGPVLPVEQRWRMFQVSATGCIWMSHANVPSEQHWSNRAWPKQD